MTMKPFEIQSPTLSINGVKIDTSAQGKLVVPGVTRAASSVAIEVEDTGDQTQTWNSEPQVIDGYTYEVNYNGYNQQIVGWIAASYSVEQLDGDGYIDGITVTDGGAGYTGEAVTYSEVMYASTDGSNWVQIPFKVRCGAGDIESEFGGGGSNTGDITFDGSVISTQQDNSLRIESTTQNTDQNAVEFNNTNLDMWAYNDDTGSYSEIKLENADNNSPWVLLNVKAQGQQDESRWAFNSNGELTFPDGTVQSTAYTGGGGGGGSGVDGLEGFTSQPEQTGDISYELRINTNNQNDSIALRVYSGGGAPDESHGPSIQFGQMNQEGRGAHAIAIGNDDVGYEQQDRSIAIGYQAGWADQTPLGVDSIAIGTRAAYNTGYNNSITLNATGENLNPDQSGLFIKPVREDTGNTTKSIYYNTNSGELTYADAPSGGGGGNANTGDVTFNGQTVIGDGLLGLAANQYELDNGRYLRVRSGDQESHIHFDTSDNSNYDLYVGDDGKYVRVSKDGEVVIGVDGAYEWNESSGKRWKFNTDGSLTVPGTIKTNQNGGFEFSSNITGISTGDNAVYVTLDTNVFGGPETGVVTISGVVGTTEANGIWSYVATDSNQFRLYTLADPNIPADATTWTAYVSGGSAASFNQNSLDVSAGSVNILTGANTKTWAFSAAGDLTLPEGGDIKDSTGTSVLSTQSLAPELTKVGGNLVSTTTLEFQGTTYGTIFDIDSGGNFDVWVNTVTGDGTGKSYAIGSNDDGYNFVYCFSTTGTVVWKVGLDYISGNQNTPLGIKYKSGYLYLSCQYYNGDVGENQLSVVKLNATDGTVDTSWVLTNSEHASYTPTDITVTSQGDPIVVGDIYGEKQKFTGLTPQSGSGSGLLIVNLSDINNFPQINPWGQYYVHTDPNDSNAWYGVSYINWFMNVPTVVVSGNGDGNLTVNLRYMYNGNGDGLWRYDWCPIQNYGSGYNDPDQVKILGSSIGGTDGVDDIILSRNSWYMNILSVGGVDGNLCPSFVYNKVRLGTSQSVDYSTGTWDISVGLDRQAFVWSPNWQHTYGDTTDQSFRSVCVDSSDNVYLLGEFQYYDNNWHRALAMKLNSSGVQQWVKYIEDDTNGSQDVGSIFTDSSDNVYTINGNNNGYTLVTKLDNTGAVVWQARQNDNNNWNNYGVGGIDSNGDVIVMGSWYGNNNYVINIHKLSGTDGSLVWSRDFNNQQEYDMYDYYDEYGQAGHVIGDNFYFGGYCYDANDDRNVGFGFRLPTDGTGTGTYGRYTYSNNTNTSYSDNTSNAVLTVRTYNPIDGVLMSTTGNSTSITADNVGATTVHKWAIGTGGGLAGVDSIAFSDGTTQTTAAGGPITWINPNSNTWRIETYNGGASVSYNGSDYDACWFHMDNSPSGMNNFRGAIIQYHAYVSGQGTIIGTIHLSNDYTQEAASHTEHMSGNNNLQFATLWDCNWETGQLFFKMTNGYSCDMMVQWTSTVFYGQEYAY